MEIRKILLKELILSDYNPRKISKKEQAFLKRNLDEFGLVDPIIINLKNYHIIGRHQRYHVLIEI